MRRVLAVVFMAGVVAAAGVRVWAVDALKVDGEEVRIDGKEMELKQQGKVVVFRDGVTVTHQNQRMESDQMIQNKETGRIEAERNVRLYRRAADGSVTTGYGDRGVYEQTTGDATLTGAKSYLTFSDPKDAEKNAKVYAKRFDFSERKNTLLARQNVKLIQSATSWATSQEAVYDQTAKTLTLFGGPPRPQLYRKSDRGESFFNSDRMVFYTQERKAELLNRVKGLLVPSSSSGTAKTRS